MKELRGKPFPVGPPEFIEHQKIEFKLKDGERSETFQTLVQKYFNPPKSGETLHVNLNTGEVKVTSNDLVLGTCSLCGGIVSVPKTYLSVNTPIPTCNCCGATKKEKLPVVEMEHGH